MGNRDRDNPETFDRITEHKVIELQEQAITRGELHGIIHLED